MSAALAIALVLVASTLASGRLRAVSQETSITARQSDGIERPEAPIARRYIVTLRDREPANAPATSAALAEDYSISIVDVYDHALAAFVMQASDSVAETVRLDRRVERVAQDGIVRVVDTQSPAPWNLDRIDQPTLPLDGTFTSWSQGDSTHVYVLDTGIRTSHMDFGGRASVGMDAVNDGRNGLDCHGHGTHVAGVIGGAQYGVAKHTSVVSVRVLGCNGSGSLSQVIAGVDWVTANAQKPAVANMSLGGASYAPLDAAVENAVASGVVFAVAAGNDGVDACTESPARVPSVLTTGALDGADQRPSWSNYGPCVKIFAPGVSVVSDWYTSDTATMVLNGTSMAAPIVAGMAAVLLGRAPDASPSEVGTALTAYASQGLVGNPGPGSPNRLAQVAPPSAHPGEIVVVAGDELFADLDDAILGTDPRSPNHDPNNFNIRSPG